VEGERKKEKDDFAQRLGRLRTKLRQALRSSPGQGDRRHLDPEEREGKEEKGGKTAIREATFSATEEEEKLLDAREEAPPVRREKNEFADIRGSVRTPGKSGAQGSSVIKRKKRARKERRRILIKSSANCPSLKRGLTRKAIHRRKRTCIRPGRRKAGDPPRADKRDKADCRVEKRGASPK